MILSEVLFSVTLEIVGKSILDMERDKRIDDLACGDGIHRDNPLVSYHVSNFPVTTTRSADGRSFDSELRIKTTVPAR
jgi:hypothetical protein